MSDNSKPKGVVVYQPDKFCKVQVDASRAQRKWWVLDAADNVVETVGYACDPPNEEFWWCPLVGVTSLEGHSLFNTEREALNRIIPEQEKALAHFKLKLDRLKERLSKLS